jgi:hypothetical protein
MDCKEGTMRQRPANAGDDTDLSHKAEEYLHAGELEKAGEIPSG